MPVKQRRGLLSWITVIPEYEDARDYPDNLKAVLVFIIAFVATTGPMGTSILMPAIDDVVKDLETSVAIVNVSVGVYLLALGSFPCGGRRSVKDLADGVSTLSRLLFLLLLYWRCPISNRPGIDRF